MIAEHWQAFKTTLQGTDITSNPLVDEQLANYEGFKKVGLDGVKVLEADMPPNVGGRNLDANSILVNKALVAAAEASPKSLRTLVNVIRHELTHLLDARASFFFPLRYHIGDMLTYGFNPWELRAFSTGDSFQNYVFGR